MPNKFKQAVPEATKESFSNHTNTSTDTIKKVETFQDGEVKQTITSHNVAKHPVTETNPSYYNMIYPDANISAQDLENETLPEDTILIDFLEGSTEKNLISVTKQPEQYFIGMNISNDSVIRTPNGPVDYVVSKGSIRKPFAPHIPLMPGHPMTKDMIEQMCIMAKQEGFHTVYAIQEERKADDEEMVEGYSVIRLLGWKGQIKTN